MANGEWMTRFPSLGNIEVPDWQIDKEDKIQWVNNDNQKMNFSTKQAWEDLRENRSKVDWKQVVWFNQMIPKNAFILWLAIQGRLMTQDRMEKWQQDGSFRCPFCQDIADSHAHLFFQCHFTKKIWEYMKNMTTLVNMGCNLEDCIQEIVNKRVQNSINVIVNKLVLAASVYYIWQERNSRIFKKEQRSEEELCNIIKEVVRFKLLVLKVKNSKNVKKVAANWKLVWKSNALYAS